ncbi:diacylglycerol kinase [Streptomyces sp. PLAI1-29]|uniref:Diacylglycerol kinase n=1 Tax=Streptomyces zingiberis TaxID=2053010 RepID=A0ABX1BVI2_9ACTN|nr:diacylglycerol kinase [Streptomyces zingiberis]
MLVVIDPLARRQDAESVRIVRDVLCAGASAKICLPDGPEDVARHLAHRGRRHPVVVGDDLALRRIVALLHRERELADAALGFVPVGTSARSTLLARELGLPTRPVSAARVVLDGRERRLDLLVDDSDGVVIGGLSIPGTDPGPGPHRPWWQPVLRTWRELARGQRRADRSAAGRDGAGGGAHQHRLRVEVDGEVLVDLDRPVRDVSVSVTVPGSRGAGGAGGAAAGADGSRPEDFGPGAPGGRRHGPRDQGAGGRGSGGHRVDEAEAGDGDGPGARARGRGTDGYGRGPRPGRSPADGPSPGPGNGRGISGARTAEGRGAGPARPGAAGRAPGRAEEAMDGSAGRYGDGPDGGATCPTDGLARVVVRPVGGGWNAAPVTAHARAITVSGPDFHYRADAVMGGPVRTRTWTVRPGALRLTLPGTPPGARG